MERVDASADSQRAGLGENRYDAALKITPELQGEYLALAGFPTVTAEAYHVCEWL